MAFLWSFICSSLTWSHLSRISGILDDERSPVFSGFNSLDVPSISCTGMIWKPQAIWTSNKSVHVLSIWPNATLDWLKFPVVDSATPVYSSTCITWDLGIPPVDMFSGEIHWVFILQSNVICAWWASSVEHGEPVSVAIIFPIVVEIWVDGIVRIASSVIVVVLFRNCT